MGVPLAGEQLEKLLSYYEMLAEANRYMNLTAIDDLDRVFLDLGGTLERLADAGDDDLLLGLGGLIDLYLGRLGGGRRVLHRPRATRHRGDDALGRLGALEHDARAVDDRH